MYGDTFEDAIDNTTAEISENGEHVILALTDDDGSAVLALTADEAYRMARVLDVYAAGL